MSEKILGKYITIDNLSNSKAEIIPVGNTEQDIIEEVKGNTVIGTNIVVNDVESTAAKIRLIGDIQQEVRDGKNLFNINDRLVITNGVTIDSDGWITITGDNTNGTETKFYNFFTNVSNLLKTSTNYNIITEIKKVTGTGYIAHVSHNATSYNSQFAEMKEYSFVNLTSDSIKTDIAKTKSDFSSSQSMLRGFVGFMAGQKGSITFRISVLEDTTITADTFKYEPYGKAPTPNFPSEVKTVTGDVKLNISNENIFVPELKVDGYNILIANGTRALTDDEYTFVASGSDMYFGQVAWEGESYSKDKGRLYNVKGKSKIYFLLTNELFKNNYITAYDKNKKSLGFVQRATNKGYYTIPSNVEYISFRFGKGGATVGETYKTKVMLSFEEISEYKKHQGEIKPLTLGSLELCKIGDYADYLYRAGSKWFKRSNVGKYVFTGNENWSLSTSWTSVITNVFYAGMSINSKFSDYNDIYQKSNYFEGVSRNTSMNNDKSSICYSGVMNAEYATITIRIDKTIASTVDEFKSWLAEKNTNGTPVVVYYILETPINTEITDTTLIAQLNAIKEASAYPGTTVIMSTGDILPINVEFTYNNVVPSPSLEIPSEVKSVGDNVNLLNFIADNVVQTGAKSNISFENDGWVKIENPNSSMSYVNIQVPIKHIVNGKPYTLKVEYADTNKTTIYLQKNSGDYSKSVATLGGSVTNIAESDYMNVLILSQANQTIKTRLTVTEGTEAKIYAPYGKGSVKINISNKNLFDLKSDIALVVDSTSQVLENGIRITATSTSSNVGVMFRILDLTNFAGKTLTLFSNIKSNSTNKGMIVLRQNNYDYSGTKSNELYYETQATTNGTYKLTYKVLDKITDNNRYLFCMLYSRRNATGTSGEYVDYTEIQLEESLIETNYIANESKKYMLQTQKPFRAIGDYKDTFINIEGKWYENHVIGKHIIIEDEIDLNFVKLENGFNRFVINAKENPIKEQYRLKLGYCNKYPYLEDFSHDSYHCYISDGGNIYMFSQAPTIEAFKSELGTNTYVIYPLDEPELIPCTPQQENILKQLQNIHMYSGTNNFYGESFIEPQINLTVKKSVEDYDMYITADGYLHIPELNKRYLVDLYESNIPIMPEAVESSVRVAGRDGDIGLNTTYEPIPFNIVCYTEDDLSLLEKVNEEKAMNKFLNKIKNKKIKLAFEKYDSYYEVKYNLALVTSNYPKHLKFSIPLKSSDSYGKELIKKIIIGSASKESDTIENVGAIFTIYGPAISPIISLNDYSMEFSTDILEGSRIEIDSNKSTITHINSDGVKTNVMKYYNHQFPKIENGNNQLKILSGIENGGNVIVEWNDLKL